MELPGKRSWRAPSPSLQTQDVLSTSAVLQTQRKALGIPSALLQGRDEASSPAKAVARGGSAGAPSPQSRGRSQGTPRRHLPPLLNPRAG